MIRVMKLSGEVLATVQLETLPGETVRSLKHHLCDILDLPVCMQRVVYSGCCLDDAAELNGLADVQLILSAASRRELAESLLDAGRRGNVRAAHMLLEASADANSMDKGDRSAQLSYWHAAGATLMLHVCFWMLVLTRTCKQVPAKQLS